jgi:nucleoside-diphosphate-sugar epimerase
MKVAVTGGSGELGTLVLRRLAKDPSITDIVAIDLQPPRGASKKLQIVKADVRDKAIGQQLAGCDALIHLAFVVTGPCGALFESVNVGGSINMFEAAVAQGIRKIVYSSSIAAYGVVPGHPVPIVETTTRIHQPGFAYSSTKYRVEEFLDGLEKAQPDLAVVRIRPAILIGAHMEHALGDGMKRRVLVSLGSTTPMPIVWDEDVADAILLSLKRAVRGAFNTASDDPRPIDELARAAGMKILQVSPKAAKRVKRVLPLLGKLHIGRETDPAWLDNLEIPMVISSEKAKTELGWKPRCRTGVEVFQHYAAVVPGRTDPRLAVFFRLLSMASAPVTGLQDARVHLALTGANGGDFSLEIRDGGMTATAGVARPPTLVLTMTADTLLGLLAGKADSATALQTGQLAIEGEPSNPVVLDALVSVFRKQSQQSGILSWPARGIAKWIARAT